MSVYVRLKTAVFVEGLNQKNEAERSQQIVSHTSSDSYPPLTGSLSGGNTIIMYKMYTVYMYVHL